MWKYTEYMSTLMLKNVVLQYYFSISVHVSGYLDTSALSFASTFPPQSAIGSDQHGLPL